MSLEDLMKTMGIDSEEGLTEKQKIGKKLMDLADKHPGRDKSWGGGGGYHENQ